MHTDDMLYSINFCIKIIFKDTASFAQACLIHIQATMTSCGKSERGAKSDDTSNVKPGHRDSFPAHNDLFRLL